MATWWGMERNAGSRSDAGPCKSSLRTKPANLGLVASLTLSLVLGACGGRSGASSDAGAVDASIDAPAVDASADAPMSTMPTITVSVTGAGAVTSAPAGIDCGSSCQASFAAPSLRGCRTAVARDPEPARERARLHAAPRRGPDRCRRRPRNGAIRDLRRGPGVEDAAKQRIFEKFGAVDNPSDRYSTGIGLTFRRMVVESYGAAGVTDQAGSSRSVFWFTLPTRPPPTMGFRSERAGVSF